MEFTPTEVILKRAKAAAACPALRDTEAKNRALAAMAQELRAEAPAILAENAADLEASRGTVSNVMLDRLALNEARLEIAVQSMKDTFALKRAFEKLWGKKNEIREYLNRTMPQYCEEVLKAKKILETVCESERK